MSGRNGARLRKLSATLAVSTVLSSFASAQTAPQVNLPTREEIQRAPQPADIPASTARVDSSSVTRGMCPEALLTNPLTVQLTSISFTGANGSELAPVLQAVVARVSQDLIGREHPIRVVCDIRDAANAALSQAGFVAAVRVPEQTVEDGNLRLEVVAAKIVELRVRGEPGGSQARIQGILDRLRALDPLNEGDAERLLLLANDIPGTSVTLELRPHPGGGPGEVIGEVAIERVPGSAYINIQNYGSREIGRVGGLLRGELYGLTGLGDRTFLAFYSTSDLKEQQVVQAGHDFAAGNDGLRFGADFTYAWTSPEVIQGNARLDLEAKSLLAAITASYPLQRRLHRNLRFDTAIEFIEQRTKAGTQALNKDELRVLSASISGDAAQRTSGLIAPAWRVSGTVEARRGLDVLGATKRGIASGNGAFPTRFEGDPEAFVVRGGLLTDLRYRHPANDAYAVTLSVDARGQYTKKPLLAFEEFAVGNLTIGRGYDPGSVSADRAYGAGTELRIGKPQPLGRKDLAAELVGFYDVVRIKNLDTGATETGRTLDSMGAGVRLTWGDRARLDVLWAHPRDRALSIDPQRAPDRVLVSLTVRAWPWRQ